MHILFLLHAVVNWDFSFLQFMISLNLSKRVLQTRSLAYFVLNRYNKQFVFGFSQTYIFTVHSKSFEFIISDSTVYFGVILLLICNRNGYNNYNIYFYTKPDNYHKNNRSLMAEFSLVIINHICYIISYQKIIFCLQCTLTQVSPQTTALTCSCTLHEKQCNAFTRSHKTVIKLKLKTNLYSATESEDSEARHLVNLTLNSHVVEAQSLIISTRSITLSFYTNIYVKESFLSKHYYYFVRCEQMQLFEPLILVTEWFLIQSCCVYCYFFDWK